MTFLLKDYEVGLVYNLYLVDFRWIKGATGRPKMFLCPFANFVRILPRCMECRRGLSVKRVHCDTRNSSEDEIANVNFFYYDIVHCTYYKIQ